MGPHLEPWVVYSVIARRMAVPKHVPAEAVGSPGAADDIGC